MNLIDTVFCHCARAIHYTDPVLKKQVARDIEEKGRYMIVTVDGQSFEVDRHYVATHRIKLMELDQLGFERVS